MVSDQSSNVILFAMAGNFGCHRTSYFSCKKYAILYELAHAIGTLQVNDKILRHKYPAWLLHKDLPVPSGVCP